MKKALIFSFLALSYISIWAFSSLGTDFFFCYPSNGNRQTYLIPPPVSDFYGMLILTSTFATVGTLHNSTETFSVPFNIPPNSVITLTIDTMLWISQTETIQDRDLRVESDNPISAYFLAYETPGASNDMALLFPVVSLGTEYIVMAWRDNVGTVDIGFLGKGPTMFCIVATEDSTSITIIPSVPTEGGHAAGVPFYIVLDAYETYQVLASSPDAATLYDLTGTEIATDKPIAVISGSEIAEVPDEIQAADYLIEQMPPLTAWGRHSRFPNRLTRQISHIFVSTHRTAIRLWSRYIISSGSMARMLKYRSIRHSLSIAVKRNGDDRLSN